MKEDTKIVELPFNQLELAQLELFLDRERKNNWVLIKIQGHKLYFENRPGDLYCYQVRLLDISDKWEHHFMTIKEREKQVINQQEELGWYFIGNLQKWCIFRQLTERKPIKTQRNWEEEYNQLKEHFFQKRIGYTLGKAVLMMIALLYIYFNSPLAIMTSNYMMGMAISVGLLFILSIIEIYVWFNFKKHIYSQLKENELAISNEEMIRHSKRQKRLIWGISIVAIIIFLAGMMIDGFFTRCWQIIVVALLMAGIIVLTLIESVVHKKWLEMTQKTIQIMYMIGLVGSLIIGIWNCISNVQPNYRGEAALFVKEHIQDLSLMTLETPKEGYQPVNLQITEKETKTLFFKKYIQYSQSEGEHYLGLNYYQTWSNRGSHEFFEFLLKVKDINEAHGYSKISGEWYGADEVYIEDYGRGLCLRKGRHIIEIEYTTENLRTNYWQNKIRYDNHKLE